MTTSEKRKELYGLVRLELLEYNYGNKSCSKATHDIVDLCCDEMLTCMNGYMEQNDRLTEDQEIEEFDCPIHGKLGGIDECPRC